LYESASSAIDGVNLLCVSTHSMRLSKKFVSPVRTLLA
jgi:hypothetical protein